MNHLGFLVSFVIFPLWLWAYIMFSGFVIWICIECVEEDACALLQ